MKLNQEVEEIDNRTLTAAALVAFVAVMFFMAGAVAGILMSVSLFKIC